jgi:hypothetical protein
MAQVAEPVEAVIISGERKGEIITVRNGDVELSAEAQALLDSVVADAQRVAESARAAAAEAEALLQELRQGRSK